MSSLQIGRRIIWIFELNEYNLVIGLNDEINRLHVML